MTDLFALYKSSGPSSNQVLTQLKRTLGIKKAGHAGTLDPFADGVLVVGIGKGTKKLAGLIGADKEYRATVHLGARSTTDDPEGDITQSTAPTANPTQEDIQVLLPQFVGEIMQTPPIYSALKRGGEALYKKARRGEQITLDPRPVTIYSISIETYAWPTLTLNVHCGKGVYIRALARDIGEALGCGAYLSALTRTRVGEYTLENAVHVDGLVSEIPNLSA